MPLDVIKTFPSLPTFDASCYRVHPPANFFLKIRNFFWDRSIGSFYKKLFFITRCGRLLVRSLFNRSWLRKIFLFSENFFISSSSIATPNRSGTSCRRSRVPSLLGSSEPSSLSWSSHSTGSTPFKLFFCWYRSLKGSGQNFYRHLVFVLSLSSFIPKPFIMKALCVLIL